ncbi:MAG: PadR family transcriptional regulator [Chloroflexota bacterium]
MYELMVLGELAFRPQHGYMIAKIIGDIIGPFRKVQCGALYPLLARLQHDGLIHAACEGERRKVFEITPAGTERLHELLLDTEHHLAEYDQIFQLKVSLFSLLSEDERRSIVTHYRGFVEQNLHHGESECRSIAAHEGAEIPEPHRQQILAVISHRNEYWRSEHAWTDQLSAEFSNLAEVD